MVYHVINGGIVEMTPAFLKNEKNITYVIATISCLVSLSFTFQEPLRNDKIYWTKEVKLTWQDFKDTPDPNNKYAAITSNSIERRYKTRNDSAFFFVQCFMDPSKSWVKVEYKSNELLKHEQLHFDIGELHARMLRKEISTFKFNARTIKEDFKKMITNNSHSRSTTQSLYDNETDHSRIAEKQKEWERKIKKALKELESFGCSEISLPLKK